MKFVSFLLACAICAGLVGCNRKPAYSNINVNASRGGGQAQASAEQPADPAAAPNPPAESTAAQPSQPGAATAQPSPQSSGRPTAIKMPAFLDGQTGEIKDLPTYPNAQRDSIQYGPLPDEAEMASLVLSTSGSMDSVAAFYDKAIKSNGWQVTVKNRDPEFSEWKVKKGEKDEGQVTVKRDPVKGLTIQIVRTTKPVQTKK